MKKKISFIAMLLNSFIVCCAQQFECKDDLTGSFKTSKDYTAQKLTSLGKYYDYSCQPCKVKFENERLIAGEQNPYWGFRSCYTYGFPGYYDYRFDNSRKRNIHQILAVGPIVLYASNGIDCLHVKINKDTSDIIFVMHPAPYGVYASRGLDGEIVEVFKLNVAEEFLKDDPELLAAFKNDKKDRRPMPIKFFHYVLLYNKKHKPQ